MQVGGKTIRTDDNAQMYTYFYKDRGGNSAFPIDSFFDVYTGKIPTSKYADKIVLIGATASGIGASLVTPISAQMNPVTTLAHSVSSILQEHFFVAPTWGAFATMGAYLLIALYVVLLLPRLSAGRARCSPGSCSLASSPRTGPHEGAGLDPADAAATLLVVGHAALTTKRYLVTERGKDG